MPLTLSPPIEALHTFASCLLAVAAVALASTAPRKSGTSDCRWLAVISLLLLVGRWATLVYPFALNPDESQLLAGAHTLRADPVFWHSVNGMTSGPLNFYALWPVGTLLGRDTYFSARLTALILLAVALGAAHLTAARRFGPVAARLGGLLPLCFLSFTAQPDFTHYSTELLSMAMIAVALNLSASNVWDGETTPKRALLTGLLLGAVPFAKPQAAPIALAIGAALVGWQIFGPGRSFARAGRLIGGAIVPLAAATAFILINHLGPYVLTAYFRANEDYVHAAHLSNAEVAVRILTQIDPTCPFFYALIASIAVVIVMTCVWLRSSSRTDRAFLISAAVLVLIAFACVIAPRRTFSHYLMLMPVPLALLLSAMVGADLRHRPPSVVTNTFIPLIAGLAAVLIGIRAFTPYPLRRSLTPYESDFSGQVTQLIEANSRPGEALAVWGWRADLYVLSGRRQAARDAVTESCIIASPFRDYFRACFLSDLARTRPAVFVDGVGPGGFAYAQRATQGHEAGFPELAALVSRDYTLVGDVEGARIYVRRDHRSLAMAPPAKGS